MELNERSKKNLRGVHPNMVRLIEESAKETPLDFTVTEGVRTAERQAQLYAQGRTAKGAIVTTRDGVIKKSNHQIKTDGFGHAVDLYASPAGVVKVNDAKSLYVIASHIKNVAQRLGIEIVWGGAWKEPHDPPHFELR